MANILLIESYKNLGSFYRNILSDEGHHVLVASDSTNAINFAHTFRFDIVIVDEGLRDRNEAGLISVLKNIQPRIKTIMCSFDDLTPETYHHLCDEKFLKTPDYTILQRKIARLIKGPVSH